MVVPRLKCLSSTKIAHLRDLDLEGLRARWQSVFQRPAPHSFNAAFVVTVIAYRLQADRFGDLDHETKQGAGSNGC